MVSVVTLTTTNASAQTWTVPADAPAGTSLTVECWGAGSGGSGGSTSFRAGGAGGAWAKSTYVVTPNDVTNGVSYTLQVGTAGTAAANSTVGPDTSFSTNNLNIVPNGTMNGAVAGTPGTLPTGWTYTNNVAISTQIVGFGLDVSSGLQYIDIRIFGTPNASNVWTVNFGPATTPVTSSTTYAASGYFQLVGGSTTNITFQELDLVANGTFVAICSGAITPLTTTLTRSTYTGSTGTATQAFLRIQLGFTSGSAVDQTIRIAGLQTEIGSSATAWKSTPGYTLAKGGGAPSGSTGGVGGAIATSIGSVATNAGGSGATRTAGGGGGGGAGKDGGGTTATTGTGGTGDAGSGGAAGVSNVEGGGGATAGTTPAIAGSPGGGGGANTSTGSGSQGGRGQIRVTYQPWIPTHFLVTNTMQPILAQ